MYYLFLLFAVTLNPGEALAKEISSCQEHTPFAEGELVIIDLLAILQNILDRALFLYIFIHKVRSSGVRASITVVQIRKFNRM